MKVKICGITNLEDALVCAEYGADMLGFVFYKNSKRFVDYNIASKIISQLPANLEKVGVFVDEDYEFINSISSEIGLTKIQLHGNESSEYAHQIKLPVIKAFRINENFNWNLIGEFSDCEILLDTFSKNEAGGTGKTFDWKLIPENYKHSIILSGGISIDNLEIIMDEIKPAAIDLSSSLEIYPGKKDHVKIKSFLQKINLWRKEC